MDSNYGRATAGNNLKVHLIRETHADHYRTLCGVKTPRSPQTTQESLPDCKRCYATPAPVSSVSAAEEKRDEVTEQIGDEAHTQWHPSEVELADEEIVGHTAENTAWVARGNVPAVMSEAASRDVVDELDESAWGQEHYANQAAPKPAPADPRLTVAVERLRAELRDYFQTCAEWREIAEREDAGVSPTMAECERHDDRMRTHAHSFASDLLTVLDVLGK